MWDKVGLLNKHRKSSLSYIQDVCLSQNETGLAGIILQIIKIIK